MHIIALIFIALVVLQSLLGGAVFFTTVGWTPQVIGEYYAQKTLHGLLETILPHTLFISIALMGSLHFLGFIESIGEQQKERWIHLLFGLFMLDQSAPVFINLGINFFAYVKLGAFVGFEVTLAGVSYLLFRHTLGKSLTVSQ
ncbi:MAG: hypothetical protein Q8J85_14020 [Sulfuricurvum sp.]|nr:hypothetical protein [Sulfuricurvum sp.]MDP3023036.1 hypothetical protein [Sulfuricurvum sp.]